MKTSATDIVWWHTMWEIIWPNCLLKCDIVFPIPSNLKPTKEQYVKFPAQLLVPCQSVNLSCSLTALHGTNNLIKRQKYFSTVPVDGLAELTQRGRVRLICVSKLIIIGSDNGLTQARYQAIIWISAEILLIGSLGTNSSENLIKIYKYSFQGVG